MRTAKTQSLMTAAQRAACRLIVHLQPASPGPLAATVADDLITIRYDQRRPNVPPVWEGFRVDCLPNFQHPDHGWEAFMSGEPGHLPACRDDASRMGA